MRFALLILHRLDPTVNMARFYTLSLERNLFGDTVLVRRWGRIGTYGRIKTDWYEAPAAAEVELDRIAKAKAKRGYCLLGTA